MFQNWVEPSGSSLVRHDCLPVRTHYIRAEGGRDCLAPSSTGSHRQELLDYLIKSVFLVPVALVTLFWYIRQYIESSIDRKARYHQCSNESQELSTRYFRPSSVVCSFRVVMCSLCGVSVKAVVYQVVIPGTSESIVQLCVFTCRLRNNYSVHQAVEIVLQNTDSLHSIHRQFTCKNICSSPPLIGMPLLPSNSVLITEVSFGERASHAFIQHLVPRILCVLSRGVSSRNSPLKEGPL